MSDRDDGCDHGYANDRDDGHEHGCVNGHDDGDDHRECAHVHAYAHEPEARD